MDDPLSIEQKRSLYTSTGGCSRSRLYPYHSRMWRTRPMVDKILRTGAKIFDGLCGVLLLGELHLKSSHAFQKEKLGCKRSVFEDTRKKNK